MKTNQVDKYIEITDSKKRNLHHVKFLRSVINQIRKDPMRKAYYRDSIGFPGRKTVYATVPCDYEQPKDLKLFDKQMIEMV